MRPQGHKDQKPTCRRRPVGAQLAAFKAPGLEHPNARFSFEPGTVIPNWFFFTICLFSLSGGLFGKQMQHVWHTPPTEDRGGSNPEREDTVLCETCFYVPAVVYIKGACLGLAGPFLLLVGTAKWRFSLPGYSAAP